MSLSYNVDRSVNCIKINADNWITDSELGLNKYRLSGRTVTTCLTKVLEKNIENKESTLNSELTRGSVILLSSVMASISRDRAYKVDGKKYSDIPIGQIMGYFKENKIDFVHLKLLYNYILVKKVDTSKLGLLYTVNENSTVGKVLRVGEVGVDEDTDLKPTNVSVEDIVLIQDNVSTEITLEGESYLLVSENSIVGIFPSENEIRLDKLDFINSSILLEEYKDESLFSSSVLAAPNINIEELDIADTYNRDMFKIVGVDKDLSLHGLKKDDIIFTDRDLTFYVYFNKKKYFLIRGISSVYGKLIKESR